MKAILRSVAILALALGSIGPGWAVPAGEVTHLSGTLSARKADGTSKLLSIKSQVEEGDLVATEADTYARLKLTDGSEIVLRPNSQLKFDAYAFQNEKPESDNVVLRMLKGGLRAVTGLIGKRNRDKVNVQTVTATIGIRGTHFGALLCQDDCSQVPTATGNPPANGLHVDVVDGAIILRNQAGQQIINVGQFGFVANFNTLPTLVPPQDGIQVTMPQSISDNRSGSQGIGRREQTECGL